MKDCIRLFFFVFLLLNGLLAGAQTVKVMDKSDLKPLKGVHILSGNNQVITDANGEADLSVFTDDLTLTFQHIGFQTQTIVKFDLGKSGYKVMMTEKLMMLDELVFSASKGEEKKADVAQQIEVISARQIAFNNPQTSADVLQQSGQVFVQQSQMGGGSPVLRGFEANKVLLVVDGVRMNNAIYRGGHLQNAITIDPNVLERVEVVFGPGSVIYGSDALGGVMHFYTRNPELSTNGKLNFKASAFTRYASANSEKSGNITLNFGLKKWGFLTSFTNKDFDDLRAGASYRKDYENVWKLNRYVVFANGKDNVVDNPEPNVQRRSGYSQYDLLQKISFQPNENVRYLLNVQYSNSSAISRYDRLSETDKQGIPTFADWYYGPQKRLFTSFRADLKGTNGFYDDATLIAGMQQIEESRISRRLNSSNKDHRIENVSVYTFNADLRKTTGRHELRYGLEATYNKVNSKAFRQNIKTMVEQPQSTRYPGGGSEMQSFSAYLTHHWELGEEKDKLVFAQGLRYSYVSLDAHFNDKTFFKFPFERTSQSNNALNGNLSLVYLPSDNLKVSALVSTGFRAPNVDDLGKVFDSQAGLLIVPNPDLKPEYTYNGELSVVAGLGERLIVEGTGFYTLYHNAIVTRRFTFNGEDSVEYNGVKSAVQANVNAQRAYLYGANGSVQVQFTHFLSLRSTLTYTYGQATTDNVPLDHIPPMYGRTSLKLEVKKLKAELFAMYNGWKRLSRYSPSGEDNQRYATPDGMPSWYTLNLRTGYQVNRYFQVQAALENIFDAHYRVFASGISAPGRNLVITLRGNF